MVGKSGKCFFFFSFFFALFCKLFLVYTDFDENVQKKENECTSYSEVTTVLLEWPRPGPTGNRQLLLRRSWRTYRH